MFVRCLILVTTTLFLVAAPTRRTGADEPDLPPGTRTDRVLVLPAGSTGKAALAAAFGQKLGEEIGDTGWHALEVPSGNTAAGLLEILDSDAAVAAVEYDLGVEAAASTLPAGGEILWSEIPSQAELLRIGADAAVARATGDGVRVAVIDTGVLFDHEAMDGHVDTDGRDFLGSDNDPTDETDGTDNDSDSHVDEDFAHGTFVASLILAVAPDARIVPFRVLDADGVGSSSQVASAIALAVSRGVDVIHLSLRIPSGATSVVTAIQNANAAGVQVVIAAGNTGAQDVASLSLGDGVITVTAVDADDVLVDFASFGPGVRLSAPGADLSGAYPEDPGTAIWSGTSFAAALVSGGCALLRELNPSWTVAAIASQLDATSVDVSSQNPGYEDDMGVGRLDLDAATDL